PSATSTRSRPRRRSRSSTGSRPPSAPRRAGAGSPRRFGSPPTTSGPPPDAGSDGGQPAGWYGADHASDRQDASRGAGLPRPPRVGGVLPRAGGRRDHPRRRRVGRPAGRRQRPPQLPAGIGLPAARLAQRGARAAVPPRPDRRRRRPGRGPGPRTRRPPHRAAARPRRGLELAGLPRPRRPSLLPLLGLTRTSPRPARHDP